MTSNMINVFQPSLGKEELDALEQVFASNWIGRGSKSVEFEHKFAEHIGEPWSTCLSVSSCTEGLFLAMQLLDLKNYHEVILPTISFHGAAEAVLAGGGIPRLCDVNFRSLNPSLDHIMEAYRGNKTRAIVLLHYGGLPCEDIAEIASFAREHDITLIEDSACSVASSVDGKMCGTFGDIGVWSFDAMKILSTGDGGMMCIKEPYLRQKAESLAWLGVSSKGGINSQEREWWKFQVEDVGRRMLMNDMTAAIGLVQLKKLPEFIHKRQEIHELYDFLLANVPWLKLPPKPRANEKSSYYLYWIRLDNAPRRLTLARYLRENGIYTTFRYWPLHKTGYFCPPTDEFVGADHASARTLNLPLHQALTVDDVKYICQKIIFCGIDNRW